MSRSPFTLWGSGGGAPKAVKEDDKETIFNPMNSRNTLNNYFTPAPAGAGPGSLFSQNLGLGTKPVPSPAATSTFSHPTSRVKTNIDGEQFGYQGGVQQGSDHFSSHSGGTGFPPQQFGSSGGQGVPFQIPQQLQPTRTPFSTGGPQTLPPIMSRPTAVTVTPSPPTQQWANPSATAPSAMVATHSSHSVSPVNGPGRAGYAGNNPGAVSSASHNALAGGGGSSRGRGRWGGWRGRGGWKNNAPDREEEAKIDNLVDDDTNVEDDEAKELANKKKIDSNGNVNYSLFEDPTPNFALPEHRMDAQKRRPNHPDYDPSTLYISQQDLNSLSPAKRQYWTIKSQNFDKIIFFKLGKFYELFDQDAVIGVQVLGLAFMGNKMHAGVPESALDKFADKLVQHGYKVAIVEQTETDREKKNRIEEKNHGGSSWNIAAAEKITKRDLIKVLTKGTYMNPSEEGVKVNANYLWIFRSTSEVGYSLCVTELSLNCCYVGHITRDENYSKLKMMIYQMRPAEIVVDPVYLEKDIAKIFENISSGPTITTIRNTGKKNFWNNLIMVDSFKSHPFLVKLNNAIATMTSGEEPEIVRGTFAGFVNYLDGLRILENHIDILDIQKLDDSTTYKNRMVLDSQALEQLEIIEATHDFRSKRDDSLLHAIDKCSSVMGKRLLKSLMCSPLMDIGEINERYDAIEELNRNPAFLKEFQSFLSKTGDLERNLSRLFTYSIKQKEKYVLFEDISATKLRELKAVFNSLIRLFDLLVTSQQTYEWQSTILKRLTSKVSEGGSVQDNIKTEIRDIEANIVWGGANKNIPVPKDGLNQDYDRIKDEIKEIQRNLEMYLREQKEKLQSQNLEYGHNRCRYELTVPDHIRVPSDYTFSSQKKGFKRYTTPVTEQFVDELEGKEEELKEQMKEFALYIFEYFNKKRELWENLTNIAKELDVLCALSTFSFKTKGQWCRPVLHGIEEEPFIDLKDSRHPIVSLMNDDFKPNDIRLGSRFGDRVILLTGPNMGGKSTMLRQVCLISIMAQIGCYVPAERCEMTVIDRIFTRLGSSDKLVEGKSTFFIEMEDIYNLMTMGSCRSLAIVDELGRGTSTTDGFAIAASVLDHMVKDIGCLSMFATHYHSLINFCLNYDEISFWKMDFLIDENTGGIVFLHKLVEGICNRSFGIKIGKLVGIAEEILKKAEEISSQIELGHSRRYKVQIQGIFNTIERAIEEGRIEAVDLALEKEGLGVESSGEKKQFF